MFRPRTTDLNDALLGNPVQVEDHERMQRVGIAVPVERFITVIAAHRLQHQSDFRSLSSQLAHLLVISRNQVGRREIRGGNIEEGQSPGDKSAAFSDDLILDLESPLTSGDGSAQIEQGPGSRGSHGGTHIVGSRCQWSRLPVSDIESSAGTVGVEDDLIPFGGEEANLEIGDARMIDLQFDPQICGEIGAVHQGGGDGEVSIDDGSRRSADLFAGDFQDVHIDADGGGRSCAGTGEEAHFHRRRPRESGDLLLVDGAFSDGAGRIIRNAIDE